MPKKLIDADALIKGIEAAIPLTKRSFPLGDAAILETVVKFIKSFDAEPQDPKPRKYLVHFFHDASGIFTASERTITIEDGHEFGTTDLEWFRGWAKNCYGSKEVVIAGFCELAS